MKKIKRRDFLKAGVGTTLALKAPWLFSCSKQEAVEQPATEITARVALIRGDNLNSMSRDVIDALGGIDTIVNQGETVFIKPNFVTIPWAQQNRCFQKGECTKPEILVTVAVECLKAGASNVIIGEGSHLPTFDWSHAVTLASKNFLGIMPLSRYAQLVENTWWNRGTFDYSSPEAIARVYLDMVANIKPDLSIIDFSIGLEGDGPTTDVGGKTVNMKERLGSWAILASTDIMAADATAARIMSHDTEKVKHLAMGYDMGLGEIREDAIEITGEKLENVRVPWTPARLKG